MREGTAGEVFRVFLGLGLTAFGGPVAHFGYFERELVQRRGWLSDAAYAEIVALTQCLPGPASSQTGMAIGLHRAGVAGMFAAWIGFTLPTAFILATAALALAGGPVTGGWIHGLKACAAAIVGLALWSMARALIPDLKWALLTVAIALLLILLTMPGMQILAIALGAVAGLLFARHVSPAAADIDAIPRDYGISRRAAIACLVLFFALLAVLPLLAHYGAQFMLVDRFYRAGALVFGTGHVILPLLEAEFVAPGLVDRTAFLAGYGLTQAMPGPILGFAAWLGAIADVPPGGAIGAALAIFAIFAPSFLLVAGTLPFWSALKTSTLFRRALGGINAAVVGLLAATFIDPVLVEGVASPQAAAIALAALGLLIWGRLPVVLVVAFSAFAGAVLL